MSAEAQTQQEEWQAALADVVAGRADVGALVRLSDGEVGRRLVAETLEVSLPIQDYDAIEALLPVCCERPDASFAAPLAAILDRQSLEISNSVLIDALGRTGSADGLPALRRALERTSVPQPDWKPGGAGDEEAQRARERCAAAIQAIESRAS